MSWDFRQVPLHKRIVTLEQGCREFDLTVTDETEMLNNVAAQSCHPLFRSIPSRTLPL